MDRDGSAARKDLVPGDPVVPFKHGDLIEHRAYVLSPCNERVGHIPEGCIDAGGEGENGNITDNRDAPGEAKEVFFGKNACYVVIHRR